MLTAAIQSAPLAVRDPADCKTCPDWNDVAGRCRHPVRDRMRICGSEALRQLAPTRTRYDLFTDPLADPGRL